MKRKLTTFAIVLTFLALCFVPAHAQNECAALAIPAYSLTRAVGSDGVIHDIECTSYTNARLSLPYLQTISSPLFNLADFTTAIAPANPASGVLRVYSKTGDTFCSRTNAGVEICLGIPTFPILAPNGTLSAPSYSFSTDPTTGMYFAPTHIRLTVAGIDRVVISPGIFIYNLGQLGWSSTSDPNGTTDLFQTRRGPAILQLGAADAAAPVAQTIAFQGSRGGTDTNTAGQNVSIQGSLGTGNAVATSLIFKTGLIQASGTTQHVATTALTIDGTQKVNIAVGVSADAGGFKHKRGQPGCITAASIGATCSTVVTWTTAFADANYTPMCLGVIVVAGVPANGAITAFSATTVTHTTIAITAVTAQFSQINCTAVHD